jgi:hypothetical protein
MLDRLAKILNQAENASTEAEAAVFMRKAQELATQYEIDLEIARQHTADLHKRETPVRERVVLHTGSKGRNSRPQLVGLMSEIAWANGLRLDVTYDSSAVILYGFPSQIASVTALYMSLAVQMTTGANAYLRTKAYLDEKVYRETRDPWGYKYGQFTAPTAQMARKSFCQSFASRVGERMREAAAATKAVEVEVSTPETPDARPMTGALVLQSRDLAVNDFYAEASNARGSYRKNRDVYVASARSAGSAAGSRARLSAQMAVSA